MTNKKHTPSYTAEFRARDWGGCRKIERHAYGPVLLSQTGVALGMALVAAEAIPHWGATIMTLAVAATVVSEIIGPPFTLMTLRHVDSAEKSGK